MLKEVEFHQIRREGDLAHVEFPAMFLSMFHTLGLEGVQGLYSWAKGIPVECWERGLQKEGMEFGEKEVALGGLEEELVIRIAGRWDSTC